MIAYNEAYGEAAADPVFPPLEKTVTAVFRPGGWLERELNLAHREQQLRMAERTAEAWLADEPLLFEAGTGVGKSLAYLIPGIMRAMSSGRPLIVSTHTIALQEQIEHHDLKICRQLFNAVPELAAFSGFRHAVMLGRSNYLCGTRLQSALHARMELFPSDEQEELQRIEAWSKGTETGLLQRLHPSPNMAVWEWVQADGHACNSRNCTPENCFFRRAREALRHANIIIVNHSLLFALLAAGHFPRGKTPGILLPEDFVVLDEAHTLPQIATEYFGLRISEFGLMRELHKLYQVVKGKPRGLLARHGSLPLRHQVTAIANLATRFFDGLRDEYLASDRPFRLRVPDWAEHALDVPLLELLHGMEYLENQMAEGPTRDEFEGARRVLDGYRNGIQQAITLAEKDSVYWLESTRKHLVVIRSAPLEVANPIRERIIDRGTGVLLTSATLAEGTNMHSFKAKIGAAEAASQQVASPFDYTMQMEILIHVRAPAPSSTDQRLDIKFLAEQIFRLSTEIPGGTLVLFTSHRDLRAVYALLKDRMTQVGRPLLCQGLDTPRSHLLLQMRTAGDAVLLGTDSFWTGVDVPGNALSQVIITRLPFENPSHPVSQARAERCISLAEDPFHQLVLPAALVKFRQGIGRLIRKHSDEGRLVILDSRILTKPYGSQFLGVLPHQQFRKIGDC